MDVDPRTGAVKTLDHALGDAGENQTGTPTGGITTQFTGAQPQRARLRATKAPIGLLGQPTRMIRVVARSLCTPAQQLDQSALDACLAKAPKVANGLVAGQYAAPTFEFIFPENVMPGDAIAPFDLWHLPFLRYGEGAQTDSGVGPLEPTPWGAPVSDLPPLPDPAPAPTDPSSGSAPAAAPVAAPPAPVAAAGAGTPVAAAGTGAPAPVTALAAPVVTGLAAPATIPAATAARPACSSASRSPPGSRPRASGS